MKVDPTRMPNWLASLEPEEYECPKCGRRVVIGQTRNGKDIPVDIPENGDTISAEVYVSHFATCPNAGEFRRDG